MIVTLPLESIAIASVSPAEPIFPPFAIVSPVRVPRDVMLPCAAV